MIGRGPSTAERTPNAFARANRVSGIMIPENEDRFFSVPFRVRSFEPQM